MDGFDPTQPLDFTDPKLVKSLNLARNRQLISTFVQTGIIPDVNYGAGPPQADLADEPAPEQAKAKVNNLKDVKFHEPLFCITQ